jgi:hypothetical protein
MNVMNEEEKNQIVAIGKPSGIVQNGQPNEK